MENRKVIYVEHITEDQGITFGISKSLAISHKNLYKVYGKDLVDKFKEEAYQNGAFRFFDKYCQFIFSAQVLVIPNFHIILTFFDCAKNVDAALDFYTAAGNFLTPDEKKKFMDLFNEINSIPSSEYAVMELLEF